MTVSSSTLLVSYPLFPPFLMPLVSHLQLWGFFFSLWFWFSHSSFFPFRLLFQTSLSWWLKKPSWRLKTSKVSSPNNISAVHCVFIMMVPWITMIRKHNKSGPQTGKRVCDRSFFFFRHDCSVHQWGNLRARGLISWETDAVLLSVHTGMSCPMLHTPTRSKRSPAGEKVNPRRHWYTNWGPPTAAMDAYKGEMRWQYTQGILRIQRANSFHPFKQLQRWGVWWYEHLEWGWLLQSVQERALLQLHWWVFGCFI